MRNLKKKYCGVGFAEALIALMISGIVSIVLMRISSSSLSELSRLEIQDEMEYLAVSTAVHLQRQAIEERVNNPDDNIFHDDIELGTCYLFAEDGSGTIDITSSIIGKVREEFVSSSSNTDDPYFQVFCRETEASDKQKVLFTVIVGSKKHKGLNTTKNDIKDYEYLAVINL
ncbi:hypothetical protein GX888_01080 [Candidatus Dojkabacteria bacterium]|uniref:Type II secretion system protein n=1 Tax=Candidatus Dojkabacteria bacterium TaxID=2099670 RepID=A0A847VCY1_9BACT|nr:hypothetical protein [Candidatus Dojkabacteria bacterium]